MTIRELLRILQTEVPPAMLDTEIRVINALETAKAGTSGCIATDSLTEVIIFDESSSEAFLAFGTR